MTMTPARWLALSWGGGVFMAAGLLFWPAVREQRELERQIAAFEEKLSKPVDGPEEIARLRTRLDGLRDMGRERSTPIPRDADVAGLIRELSGVLERIGLSRREVTTGTSRQLEEAASMPMSVLVDGAFPGIYEAVRRVEGLPRLVRVQRLRVEAQKPDGRGMNRAGEVHADLLIDVFYAPREARAVSAADGPEVRR
ncbi:MAG: type 4a pilus biogenesis protein PilO [Phycisphaerales bacterium]|nr:type 4a pilus biogenesis protein PilO [Phycisphaerales bacterium]